jgi:RNA recognition motif-containing protein
MTFHISKPPEEDDADDRTAFISNLPESITEFQIRQKFKHCGDIEEIRLKKGFCYIQFKN